MSTVPNTYIGRNKFGVYCVPKEARYKPDIQLLDRHEVHEEKTIEFMQSNSGDGIIIHAGTFFGDFLPALGRLPNKVYAFEPVNRFYACAQETLRMNDLGDNIVLTNKGLGEGSYTKKIMTVDADGKALGGSALMTYDDPTYVNVIQRRHRIDKDHKQIETQDAAIVSLDEFIPEEEHDKVSILQLDLEGYEEKALSGALDIIEKSKPILIVEFWRDPKNPDRVPPEFEHAFYKKEIFGRGYEVVESMYQNKIFKVAE